METYYFQETSSLNAQLEFSEKQTVLQCYSVKTLRLSKL